MIGNNLLTIVMNSIFEIKSVILSPNRALFKIGLF